MVFHATENIWSFFWELKDYLFWFLKYHASFVNTKERSFYQLPALKKISFYSQKSIISTFSSSEKFIIWSFSFVQSSCFCNNFFLTFMETYTTFPLTILKDLLNLHYKKIWSWIKKLFLSEFPVFATWYMSILVASEIAWNRILFQFCRNRNKDVCILTETHINLAQIYHIRNNWLDAIFFSPGDTKRLLFQLYLGFEDVTEVKKDPKGRFVSFKVPPSNDRVLCVYAPSGHRTREQLVRKHFF